MVQGIQGSADQGLRCLIILEEEDFDPELLRLAAEIADGKENARDDSKNETE